VSNIDVPSRASKTAEELLAALNKVLHAHPECRSLTVSKLLPLANVQDGLANWDAEFAAEPGNTMSAECKRLALSAKQSIQKHFDLAGGE
jgi:hypothetical protein